MTDALDLIGAERLTSASMFAVEFVDPVTDRPIQGGLRVWADSLGPPIRTLSGRYAWTDIQPPANRSVTIHAVSTDGAYAEFRGDIPVPAHTPGIAPATLLFHVPLVATGLYVPPQGATAFAGELVTAGPPVRGLAGIAVTLVCICEGTPFASGYVTTTDTRGGFVAVMRGLDARIPDLKDGVPAGYLSFARAGAQARFTKFLPLRPGRLVYADAPLHWDGTALSLAGPQLP